MPAVAARFAFLDHPGPLAFAHRGGGGEKPENTLAAFAHAVELGFRYVETDVRVTRDGVAVTFHDPTLERATDGRGRVREHTWAELRRVKVAGREPVARLDDLLGAWPDLRVNLDPKSDAAVGPLAEAVRRTGAIERVCVASFSDGRLRRLRRELGPRLCTSLGPLGVARLRLASLGLPGGGFRAGAAQVKARPFGVPYVDRALLAAARRHGLDVHVWTVDEPDHMDSLLDLGVAGLMSGRPRVLKAVLQRRGTWSGG